MAWHLCAPLCPLPPVPHHTCPPMPVHSSTYASTVLAPACTHHLPRHACALWHLPHPCTCPPLLAHPPVILPSSSSMVPAPFQHGWTRTGALLEPKDKRQQWEGRKQGTGCRRAGRGEDEGGSCGAQVAAVTLIPTPKHSSHLPPAPHALKSKTRAFSPHVKWVENKHLGF